MNLTIPFTKIEEACLHAAARQAGLTPTELIKQLTLNHLPVLPADVENEVDAISAKLRMWQQEDGTPLRNDLPTMALFARWAAEDAQMTDEEHDAEDALWEDIEKKFITGT